MKLQRQHVDSVAFTIWLLIRLLTIENGQSIRHVLFKIIELFKRFICLFLDKKHKLFWMILSLIMSGILSGDIIHSWWRHQMETFSALLALCAGNSPVTGELPSQRSVTQSFDVFFDLHLNKRSTKQSRGWWFETPSRPFWCHCNAWKMINMWQSYLRVEWLNHPYMFVGCEI